MHEPKSTEGIRRQQKLWEFGLSLTVLKFQTSWNQKEHPGLSIKFVSANAFHYDISGITT
jgi:hypothetical protein